MNHSQKKRDTRRFSLSFVFMLKVSAIATVVNSRVAALTGTSPSAASSEWTLLHSGFSAQEKPSVSAVIPPLRKKARSAHLFACKRAHVGSLPLPPFCGLEKQKYSEETGSNASGSEQGDPGFLTGRWFKRCCTGRFVNRPYGEVFHRL